jgi:hypothetical protein
MSMRRFVITVLGLVSVMAVGFGVWLGSGSTRRGAFSPDTLGTRSWSERSLPFCEVLIWRGERAEYQWPVVRFLVAEGYWTPVNTDGTVWLGTSWETPQGRDGISHLAMELGGHGEDWVKWSKAHPELSRQFWGRLLARLRRGDQAAVSEAGAMFLAVRYSASVEEFERMMAE